MQRHAGQRQWRVACGRAAPERCACSVVHARVCSDCWRRRKRGAAAGRGCCGTGSRAHQRRHISPPLHGHGRCHAPHCHPLCLQPWAASVAGAGRGRCARGGRAACPLAQLCCLWRALCLCAAHCCAAPRGPAAGCASGLRVCTLWRARQRRGHLAHHSHQCPPGSRCHALSGHARAAWRGGHGADGQRLIHHSPLVLWALSGRAGRGAPGQGLHGGHSQWAAGGGPHGWRVALVHCLSQWRQRCWQPRARSSLAGWRLPGQRPHCQPCRECSGAVLPGQLRPGHICHACHGCGGAGSVCRAVGRQWHAAGSARGGGAPPYGQVGHLPARRAGKLH